MQAEEQGGGAGSGLQSQGKSALRGLCVSRWHDASRTLTPDRSRPAVQGLGTRGGLCPDHRPALQGTTAARRPSGEVRWGGLWEKAVGGGRGRRPWQGQELALLL